MSSDRGASNLELTRSSSGSQKRITEMQFDLLISHFKNPKTIALVKENIGRISDGSSSHSADALNLGLNKAFELKRRNCVSLRCPHGSCSWHTNHPSYSSVGSNILCQNCVDQGRGRRYLECTGCECNRTNALTSCQKCRKMFL